MLTYSFTNSGLIDLDGADTSLLEINDFIAESKGKLLRLQFPGDIGTRERPVEDGDGTSQHSLHGFGSEALSIARPLDGHGGGAADIGDDDGRTDVAL